jgi:hypothetical protein
MGITSLGLVRLDEPPHVAGPKPHEPPEPHAWN